MCPMCVTTAMLIAGGLASTGGLAAVTIKKLRSRRSAASELGDDGRSAQVADHVLLALDERNA